LDFSLETKKRLPVTVEVAPRKVIVTFPIFKAYAEAGRKGRFAYVKGVFDE